MRRISARRTPGDRRRASSSGEELVPNGRRLPTPAGRRISGQGPWQGLQPRNTANKTLHVPPGRTAVGNLVGPSLGRPSVHPANAPPFAACALAAHFSENSSRDIYFARRTLIPCPSRPRLAEGGLESCVPHGRRGRINLPAHSPEGLPQRRGTRRPTSAGRDGTTGTAHPLTRGRHADGTGTDDPANGQPLGRRVRP